MEFDSQAPIGIFDSGIGGLTVAYAISRLLPQERIIYFGDTAHLPYGEKSADAIRYYAIKISKFLLQQNCKMIVIACNSASSAAYEILLDFFDEKVLFVNVVDPLVEKLADNQAKNIGVIATKATINSNTYRDKIQEKDSKIKVNQLATPLLVPMIEEAYVNNNISHSIIENYLSHPSLKNIDSLLLACTHYPLIKKEIEDFYNHKVQILDSTDVVANKVKQVLEKAGLLSSKKIENNHFYVSDYTSSFEDATKLFYGAKIHLEERNIW